MKAQALTLSCMVAVVAPISLGLLSMAFGASANAAPIFENIVSDTSWKSNDTGTNDAGDTDWETIGFDDNSWSFARAPYPNPTAPNSLFGDTTAQHMWYDPNNISDGTTGVIRAFFRKTFTLNVQPDSLPLTGQALIAVDDDYEFYVNGVLVFENKDGGFADKVDFVDFTAELVNGANVFAIEAVDGGWNNPRDRIYERALFDATIATVAVPVPTTLALIGLGLAGLGFARRRRVSA